MEAMRARQLRASAALRSCDDCLRARRSPTAPSTSTPTASPISSSRCSMPSPPRPASRREVLFLDKGLEERILAEGENSPADVILTVDISRLTTAKEKGVTQPLDDATDQQANLPAEYRDPDGALVRRHQARPRRLRLEGPGQGYHITYADLADPKWKGKICIRSGQHDYNLALFSAAIAHWGEAKTEEWMTGLKDNLAHKPDGGDRSAGQGDLRRRVRHRARQHLLCRPDADQREGSGGEGMGQRRSTSSSRPSERRRHACQHFRRGARQACAEPRQRASS